MEVKKLLEFAVEKNDRVYKFSIEDNAPLGDSFEAVSEFKNKMVQLINDHCKAELDAQKPKEDESEFSETEE